MLWTRRRLTPLWRLLGHYRRGGMATVALIVHEMRDDAERSALELAAWLAERGHKLALLENNADEVPVEALIRTPDELAHGTALVVSLGGDGSMLRAVQLAAPHNVPVLGVNFGQLGYLTEVEPHGMIDAIERTLNGEVEVESRMRVAVTVARESGEILEVGHALNEALVERDESGRTVRLGATIDGEYFISYNADGMIVASPNRLDGLLAVGSRPNCRTRARSSNRDCSISPPIV